MRLLLPAWRATRAVAQALFTALWCAAFRLVGRVRPSEATVVSPSGGRRVLVVAPHPDDEVIGCGGAILRHKAADDRVAVVYATDGRRSGAFGLSPAEMAARRREEAARSAAILGVDCVEWLGLAEGEWRPDQIVEPLSRVIASWRPHLLYAPSRVDFHPEHWRVAHGLARALSASDADDPPVVRVYQVYVPLTAVLVNRVMSLGAAEASHQAALEAHASQLGSIRRGLRMKRYAAHRHGLSGLAEEFWELPARSYHALHEPDAGPSVDVPFRGLRFLAATDPLAYLAGRTARGRLRDDGVVA